MGGQVGPDAEDVQKSGIFDALVAAGIGVVDAFSECGAHVVHVLDDGWVVWGDAWGELELEDLEDWHFDGGFEVGF